MPRIVLSLVFLSLLALPSFARAADEEPKEGADAPVSFNGTWKTIYNGTTTHTLILKQVDATVTGTYSPGNGKITEGVVTGNKLTFQWSRDGGVEGTAEFTLDVEDKSLTGSATVLKPKEATATWNTYIPPVSSFAGTWDSITNGKHSLVLVLKQKGDKVKGTYVRGNGTLEGTVTGRVLRFNFESDGGTGSGRLVMEDGGQAFYGTYNNGDDPDDVDNTWNGKLPTPPAPKPTEEKPPPEKPAAPPSFTGIWVTKFGNANWVLIFNQAEGRVTGFANNAEYGGIREGIVDGKKLTFKVVRDGIALPNGQRSPDITLCVGVIVLDEGGKSFTGTISNAPATGTLFELKKEPLVEPKKE